jgi:hypothetical protein
MIASIKSNLNSSNCASALEKSELLFDSKYTSNEVRMLHASSYGCIASVQLLALITAISSENFTFTAPAGARLYPYFSYFDTIAEVFASNASTDAKVQSLWKMQDVLQSVLNPGAVIADFDQNVLNAYNTGSMLFRDRTDDANTLLMFSSMALMGSLLSRYGNPVAGTYKQGRRLASTWSNESDIKIDPSKTACSIASSVLNMYDGISVMSVVSSGSLSTALTAFNLVLDTMIQSGKQRCENGQTTLYQEAASGTTYGSTRCNNAVQRLRYRNACYETDKDPNPVAAYAFGIMTAIDGSWEGM